MATTIDIASMAKNREVRKINGQYVEVFPETKAQYVTVDDWQGSAAKLSDVLTSLTNVVHTSGNETIGGTKTFTANQIISKNTPVLTLQMNNLDCSQTSTTSQILSAIAFSDKNGTAATNRTGSIRSGMGNADYGFIQISAWNPDPASTAEGHITVAYPRNGTPYATAPTTPAGATGTEIITADYFNNTVVKLSGDQTVGGVKNFNGLKITSYGNIVKENNTGQTLVCAGTTNSAAGGAYLTLRGAEHSTTPGRFALSAAAGSVTKTFVGDTDGTLTWSGKAIAIDENVVHKAGDETVGGAKTFTSGITFSTVAAIKREANNDHITIYGCTGYGNGAYLTLYGKDETTAAGKFTIRASDGTSNKDFTGLPDGTLTWDGKGFVYTSGDQTITGQKTFNTLVVTGAGNLKKTDDTHDLWLCSGTGNTVDHGAYIGLYGASNSGSYPGVFQIATGKVNNQYASLLGKPDGTLTWNGKNVATTDSDITGKSANVTGTVAIANGGTGATTRLNAFKNLTNSNVGASPTYFVTFTSSWATAGYSSVANVKTALGLGSAAYTDSTDYAASSHTHDYLPLSGGNLTESIKLNTTSTVGIYKGNATSLAEFSGGSAINKGGRLCLYGESHSSNAGRFDLVAGNASTSKSLIGKPDGTLTWGGQSVSTSSDERIKTKLQQVPEDILNAWGDVEWGEFKFLEAVADKGENARLHTGLIAQAVDRVFKAKDLDACKYGILCHEEREATEEEPAVDLWTVRYTEALCMEAAYQRRRADRAESRITALEQRLDEMETVIATLGFSGGDQE